MNWEKKLKVSKSKSLKAGLYVEGKWEELGVSSAYFNHHSNTEKARSMSSPPAVPLR